MGEQRGNWQENERRGDSRLLVGPSQSRILNTNRLLLLWKTMNAISVLQQTATCQ